MTLDYKVFHSVGVVVADVKSPTLLSVQVITTDEPPDLSNSDRQFDVDLALTPYRAPDWSNVTFDDYETIVPTKDTYGSVYIEHNLYNDLYNNNKIVDNNNFASQWPPTNWKLATLTSIVYWDPNDTGIPRTVIHYHGYWAQVTDRSSGFKVTFSDPNSQITANVDFDDINVLSAPPLTAYGNDPRLMGTEAEGSWGVVFVERSHADQLGLLCPKVPIGLDTFKPPPVTIPAPPPSGDPPPNVRPNPGQGHKIAQRINISLVDPDPILEMVLDKIDDEARVAGAFPTTDDKAGVSGIVSSRNKPGLPVAIDLIAHAYEGVLEFGTWQITSTDQISIMLEGEWKNRSPSEIRLLGCNTALTTAGQAAMRHLKSVFREKNTDVRVYGAKTMLFAYDFGPEGFQTDDELVEVDALPEAIDPPFLSDVVDRWFARFPPVGGPTTISVLRNSLRTETFDEARAARIKPWVENRGVVQQSPSDSGIDDLFSEFGGSIVRAPGLLEHPDSEQLYPAGFVNGERVFHRVTTFRGGAFVRVYTRDFPDGVLVRRQASSP